MTAGPELEAGGVEVAALIGALAADGATVATAESITGGRLVAELTSVPGSSAVVRGGVVAYSSEVKVRVLGVESQVLREQGAVCADVAEQMAEGVRERLGATYGLSTTGEAGPDSASGRPVGTIYVAAAGPLGITTRRHEAAGTREQIQRAAVAAALDLLARVHGQAGTGAGAGPDPVPGDGNNRG